MIYLYKIFFGFILPFVLWFQNTGAYSFFRFIKLDPFHYLLFIELEPFPFLTLDPIPYWILFMAVVNLLFGDCCRHTITIFLFWNLQSFVNLVQSEVQSQKITKIFTLFGCFLFVYTRDTGSNCVNTISFDFGRRRLLVK